ncbi:MAG: bifunctional UDP-N-acetylglucosamine diphosphorylase/glucosamine-1-phosphate N-acetyltransferase GlmU [Porticoccaceae bacterium]|jgi:bifunctional UDP-N-acetylglucosamine pyrophosphorylase/glucosamine-1-phosphate N-acetyltransferase|nr:bifunctional UDP-N-acetylglucosamine diphosphorylase/glucosamine-1-phosphate N-acetyltransferase GlmU [Porticoccaceae bacterium]
MTKVNFVILAAGKGTRMRSSLPKVLHKLSGRSMLGHVVAAVESLGKAKKIIVTGHGAEQVEQQFKSPTTIFTQQKEQLGTGHAVHMAVPELCSDALVIVLYGDVPLIRPVTIQKILAVVTESTMGLLTINLDQPTGYGRIVRNTKGEITEIIEQQDASAEQLKITEVNTGVLALQSSQLRDWLPKITNNNAQGEYYLTDLVSIAREAGVEIVSVNPESATEVEGVNNRVQLSQLERAHQRQLAEVLMESGTSLADPARFDQRGDLSAGTDNFIDINCVFNGSVTIGSNVSIGANCQISDSTIGDGVSILPNTIIESSVVGDRAVVGPFARLRPGTRMESDTKVGNFVETKKTLVGKGSKINHLSYVGDAQLGENVNIGAGTITCNYDGVSKHKTDLGDGVFVGSNSTLVAPIKVDKGGFIAAGSTVTTEVPSDSLAVGRAKQRNIKGWKRPTKKEV